MLFLKNNNHLFFYKKTFTFVELIIVVLIISFISLGLYNVLNSGLRIWRKLKEVVLEENINIVFEKFNKDLRNTFFFKDIDFFGTKNTLEFPTLVKTKIGEIPGKVFYFYDINKKSLVREERNFSELYTDREGLKKILLDNIEALNFKYYYYDSQKLEYSWYDETEKQKYPLAVKLEIRLKDGINFNKIVSIPVSN